MAGKTEDKKEEKDGGGGVIEQHLNEVRGKMKGDTEFVVLIFTVTTQAASYIQLSSCKPHLKCILQVQLKKKHLYILVCKFHMNC